MRHIVSVLTGLALTGCAAAYQEPAVSSTTISTTTRAPEVTQHWPSEPASLDPADSVLFWSDERRSAAFRKMSRYFPGNFVKHSGDVRALPNGAPLSSELQALMRTLMEETGATGTMVLHGGEIVFEDYAQGLLPSERWTSFSVAKSMTSTLLGAAIADGAIASVDTSLIEFVPELAGTAYDGVSVGQVATMTSGVAWNEDYTDPNSDVARMLAIPPVPGESQVVTMAKMLKREAPAGEKFVYKTLETNLLGLIVERATGQSLAQYAATKIVEPAGFAGSLFWMQDLTGGNIGGCCLSLTLADYARFGQFVLEGGEGVVPEGWFAEAGGKQVDFGPDYNGGGFGYGYQWWVYPGGTFGAQGIFGQGIMLVPSQQLVIAYVSNWKGPQDPSARAGWLKLAGEVASEVAAQ